MAWYNFLDLVFGLGRRTDFDKIVLRCDNPQCDEPITKGPVAYERTQREIYHPGDCPILACSRRAMDMGRYDFGEVECISFEKARDLYSKGKLTQSEGRNLMR